MVGTLGSLQTCDGYDAGNGIDSSPFLHHEQPSPSRRARKTARQPGIQTVQLHSIPTTNSTVHLTKVIVLGLPFRWTRPDSFKAPWHTWDKRWGVNNRSRRMPTDPHIPSGTCDHTEAYVTRPPLHNHRNRCCNMCRWSMRLLRLWMVQRLLWATFASSLPPCQTSRRACYLAVRFPSLLSHLDSAYPWCVGHTTSARLRRRASTCS
mmetsp:Transcript_9831/g.34939  ORF Transcript_9831/g.34939 Transcript_9831/m.34939 type:complete len:207 (+) Transcript_9831:231-851(+)